MGIQNGRLFYAPEKIAGLPPARKKMIYTLFILFLSFSVSSGQNDPISADSKKADQKKDFPVFESDDLLEISISFDLTKFQKKNLKEGSFDALLTIHLGENDSINKKATLKYRGINRLERCSFPPIQINFKTPLLTGSDSSRIKRLKLVTHCEQGSLYEEYVLREYLVYKLFNVLTDTSYKVRLLKINYIDSQKSKKPLTKYGFFIEPIEILAARTNTTIVKSLSLSQSQIIPDIMDRLAIFNFMVANWDWSVAGQHNVSIVCMKKNTTVPLGIAVPYDFDLTGIVNASFAIPPPERGIETVRDRLYMGMCRSGDEFKKDLMKFMGKKEGMYSVINDFPWLNQRCKRDICMFLDQFFNQLERPKGIDNLVNLFSENCKKKIP